MVDRARPLKLEESGTGTEDDVEPTEIDPGEDFVEARGFAIQDDSSSDEGVLVSREAATTRGTVKDAEVGTVDFQRLVTGARGLKDPVRAATTSAGTLATDFENGDSIDGVTLATGDRILLQDQSTGSENGIRVVQASGAPVRATDFDQDDEVRGGLLIPVSEGTENGNKVFQLTTNDPIVIGTTALVFAQVGDGGAGGGDDIQINSSGVSDANFNDGTPTPPAGAVNVDWVFSGSNPADISASVQGSTEAQKGVIEIATQAETDAGTDDTRAVTPAKLVLHTKATAVIADNRMVRGDGGARGIQQTGITVSDNDEVRHAGTVEWDKGADIASGATLTIGTDGNAFDVTGAVTIGTISAKPIGTRILLRFDGTPTLTNSATLALLGGVDFVAVVGDLMELINETGGTSWREIGRQTSAAEAQLGFVELATQAEVDAGTDDVRAVTPLKIATHTKAAAVIADHRMVRGDGGARGVQQTGITVSDNDEVRHAGTVEWDKGGDLVSAAALVLDTDGNYFDVTGTTTITSVGTKPIGTRIMLQFDGIVTVTHNATTLILAGGVNFVTVAGNLLELISEGSGNWREVGRVGAAAGNGADTEFSDTEVQTSSTSFVDAFAGAVIEPPIDGDYMVLFEAEMGDLASPAEEDIEIAIGKNSTTVAETGSPRVDAIKDFSESAVTTLLMTGLVTTDNISGIFRSVGGGTAELNARRISMWKVN